MNAIELRGLSKSFGKKIVLENIDLTIPERQIVGLLGPNGSGKTTLLKILAGALTDYSGEARIHGEEIGPTSKALVAYLPERPIVDENWLVEKLIEYYQDMFSDFDKEKSIEMLHRFKLDEKMRIKSMSKGMKEKLSLAVLMGRNAKVYLLDEPLGGVDPASRGSILEKIISNFNEDSTMIISTHLISDIEPILDRVVFIKDAQIILNEEADTIRLEQQKSIDEYFREVYRDEGVF